MRWTSSASWHRLDGPDDGLIGPFRRYGRKMITAIHTLVYSDDATATRAFFKDVLQWPFVSEGDHGDAGTGSGTGGKDPAEWLGNPDAPAAKHDNEKPQGETDTYDELVKRWSAQ